MRWLFRRVGYWWLSTVAHGQPTCTVRACPYRAVGFSIWCREHTDQIMEHRESLELQFAIARNRRFSDHACDRPPPPKPACYDKEPPA